LDLKFEVYAKIRKPIEEVFDAVYNPKKLSGYFTTGSSSGTLDEGKDVTWDFHDFPGAFPVHIKRTIKNEKIILEWANSEGNNNQVEIDFSTRINTYNSIQTAVCNPGCAIWSNNNAMRR
jgi:uncharacterized protein YndB with AHSA1/START domain